MSAADNVKSIVAAYLEEKGYDGLCGGDQGEECQCALENLFYCDIGYQVHECQPGYKAPCDCDEGCKFHIIADG